MKIVFIAPFGIRPKGTLIARMLPLAAGLQSLGHTVTIVAPPYTNPEDSGKFETVRGVLVKNVKLGPSNKIAAAVFLPYRLLRTAMLEKPDLVHLFKPKGYGGLAAFALILFKRLGRRLPPLFIDTDDWEGPGGMNDLLPYSPAERIVFRFQEEWLPPRAAGVTVASLALRARIMAMGIPAEKIHYLPNSVDPGPVGNRAATRGKLGIPDDIPVLLLYTRFFEFSQEKLHQLFADIHRQIPEVRFLVIGSGRNNEEELLTRAGEELGFLPALILAGWLDPSKIIDYLAAADVAIYPFADTLLNRSKCPAKLTEILLAEIPVVADRVGQIAEYIQPGISGVLCNPDDWREMADRTLELLLDRAKGRALGTSGRAFLLEKFNWNDAAAELDSFYQRLLSPAS